MIDATIAGHLGQDPDLKYSQRGDAVCKLRVACNYRDKVDGEWVDQVQWVSVTTFGKRGEGLNKILAKGAPVVAVGQLKVNRYEKRDGSTGIDVELVARDVKPMGGKGGGRSGGSQRGTGGGSREQPPDPEPPADDFGDDDIPF